MTISPRWRVLLLLFTPVSLYLTLKLKIFIPEGVFLKKNVGILGVFAAFFLYLFVSFIIPLVTDIFIDHSVEYNFIVDDKIYESLMQIAGLVFACTALVLFCRRYSSRTGISIFGTAVRPPLFMLCKGIVFSLIAYPTIMLAVQLVHACISLLVPHVPNEQLAILQLKKNLYHPVLFWTFITLVVTVVPVIEEILFRGFFQNYLVTIFGSKTGIVISSLLFSGFHFATQQGYTNIELLTGLFLLSYGIGCTYLKEQSLLAPIGMHAGFNAVSVCLMLQQV